MFVALAVVLATLFVRLGFWQLSRLGDRRARNAVLAAQLAKPATTLDSLAPNEAYRWVTIEGVPDYANEIVHAGRSRNGSPGVHLYTPVRVPGRDTAVLVNRGWVYSPDAAAVDLEPLREAKARFGGLMLLLPAANRPAASSRGRTVRELTPAAARALVPYPLAGTYMLLQDSSAKNIPARIPAPALTDGPHMGYAIQWFGFALTALVGAGIVVFRARGQRPAGSTAAKR